MELDEATSTNCRRARVMATFMRRSSAKNPILLWALFRTNDMTIAWKLWSHLRKRI
jgi:hypothetical protein